MFVCISDDLILQSADAQRNDAGISDWLVFLLAVRCLAVSYCGCKRGNTVIECTFLCLCAGQDYRWLARGQLA